MKKTLLILLFALTTYLANAQYYYPRFYTWDLNKTGSMSNIQVHQGDTVIWGGEWQTEYVYNTYTGSLYLWNQSVANPLSIWSGDVAAANLLPSYQFQNNPNQVITQIKFVIPINWPLGTTKIIDGNSFTVTFQVIAQIVTDVENLNKTVLLKKTEYFNLQGNMIDLPISGEVFIQRNYYSNNVVETKKVYIHM